MSTIGTPLWGEQAPVGSSGSGSPPVVSSFTASPSSLTAGESSDLAWVVVGATTISIDNSIGTVAASGTQSVQPNQTTTYILTANNSSGQTKATVVVAVNGGTGSSGPTVSSFVATPSAISSGGSATLSWATSGAASVVITSDQDAPGTVSPSGSAVVSPLSTSVYTLVATGADSLTTSASVTITVDGAGSGGNAPAINSFTASPTTVNAGDSTTLSWSVSDSTDIEIDQGVGAVDPSGSQPVTLTATTTYTLTAINPNGVSKATLSVAVNGSTSGSSPVIADFTATPTTVPAGSQVTFAWTVTGADSISIDPGIGTVAASGSQAVTPDATTTYTLTAINSAGTTTADILITAGAAGAQPVIQSFTGSPSPSTPGGAVTLSWVVLNADTISLNPGGVVAGTSQVVNPQTTTAYRLTATNASGSASQTFTVLIAGPAAENVRYHQVRRFDREGDAHQIQMYGGQGDSEGWPAVYDGTANINGVQPRGNSGIPQMASAVGAFTPNNVCAFDDNGNIIDGGSSAGGAGSRPFEIIFEAPGLYFDAEVIGLFTMPSDLDATGGVTFPDSFSHSRGHCIVNPTASAAFAITRVRSGSATGFCTVSIDTSGAFSFAGSGDDTLLGGDTLIARAPTTSDDTLSDVSFTLAGVR